MCSSYGLLLRVNPFNSRGLKLMRVCTHHHAVEQPTDSVLDTRVPSVVLFFYLWCC
jgi:hypothetical protein